MRTPDYVPYTENYISHIGSIIAKAQITNGGPVILVQPENEYSQATPNVFFPNHQYFADVEQQLRDAGIVVPFVSNDAAPHGYFAPGTGLGAVDIYGHDSYPLGFDCANPDTWPNDDLPTDFLTLHLEQSPSTPYTVSEFQGGSFDPWGGSGFEKCYELTNQMFERIFYKNLYAVDITIFNIYMIYGGTNWGNLGHPGGYTSYDYGAAIAEDRTVIREKYSEVKLQANFLRASPAYLTATADQPVNGSYVSTNLIATTRVAGKLTGFYIVRHAAYNTLASTNYTLTVQTSQGTMTIPRLSGSLTLNGRDSKIHVTDYDVGGVNLLYSTAEIFTWKKYENRTVLILYGGLNETHEVALVGLNNYLLLEGTGVDESIEGDTTILNWAVTGQRKIVCFSNNFYVYLLSRYEAYDYWVLDLPGPSPVYNYTTPSANSVIIRAGYLLRTASLNGTTLALTGDVNATTTIAIIGAPQFDESQLKFNGEIITLSKLCDGSTAGTINYVEPTFHLPALSDLTWKYIDSLPEVLPTYDDSAWPDANIPYSNNTVRNLTTPTSLYGSDYGFNTGNLLFRGHFISTGAESAFSIQTQGGTAYAASVYLNQTLIGVFPGNSAQNNTNQTLTLPSLQPNQPYIITVLIDNMGLDEDNVVGSDENKDPRGILNYSLSTRIQDAITWKLTGNLGGENYRDRVRGPLNEGGLYAERQGYHLPYPPSTDWEVRNPVTEGITTSGVGFFSTNFTLDMPLGYDIPLSFVFTNTSTIYNSNTTDFNYRCQLYVNGYQFGKYVNNIGPQTSYPVPEGILDYHGENWIAVTLWGSDMDGNTVGGLELTPTAVIQSGYGVVQNAPMPAWTLRPGAY
jgi:hypothetical protein